MAMALTPAVHPPCTQWCAPTVWRLARTPCCSAVADIRKAEGDEVAPVAGDSLFDQVSTLCANHLFSPASRREEVLLTREMRRNLVTRFSAASLHRNALFVAEDVLSGEIVASCGLEVSQLDADGRAARFADELLSCSERPLLSNLVVVPQFRRQGIARRLVRTCEATARRWGYDELLIKVERGNSGAERLYAACGYALLAVDTRAEKPQAGRWRVRWVPTTNLVLRKRLASYQAVGVLPSAMHSILGGLLQEGMNKLRESAASPQSAQK
eukprot:CAMPEP_0119397962 /NCGR_PEP_ID=MMETSP1334-20130426/140589_1 /TAXON_ID=127549 /ORGANISM="Calcidiscus leptoporus, Strain RCC1130" /LENGTH=269 /DNA_ID=CAMNT_0007421813 /DNA_START=52 /DNA_END=861 /DNA_ORIENTATION=-